MPCHLISPDLGPVAITVGLGALDGQLGDKGVFQSVCKRPTIHKQGVELEPSEVSHTVSRQTTLIKGMLASLT